MRAFLFDVDAWLSSTDVSMMSAVEERGYLRLLLHAWKQEDCGLPDDDGALAALSLIGDAWRKSSAKIRRCFEARDGRLYNARLLKEWEYQKKYHARQKGAADARWGDRTGSGTPPPPKPRNKRRDVPPDMPPHMPRHEDGMSHGNASLNTAYAVEQEQEQNQKPKAAAAKEPAAATPPPLSERDHVEIAQLLQMAMAKGTPSPIDDPDIIRRVQVAMQGATLPELAAALIAFRRKRPPPERYGFWPMYLTDVLSPAARAKLGAIAQTPVEEPVEQPPACEECRGSGVIGSTGGTPEEVRAKLLAGFRLCGCESGQWWMDWFAMNEEEESGGVPTIQRQAVGR